MSQPVDEKHLGELLVTAGKLSQQELLACLQAQRQIGGAKTRRLDEILVERGHLSQDELQATLRMASPSPVARETWPNSPAPGGGDKDVSEKVQLALTDPSRRIGRYAWIKELGRGGMGVVHRCYDPQLHRHVAIKMILEAGMANEEGLARFHHEARAVAKLHHPGIVALHEVGEHQGSPYLVMDFVEGQSFEAFLIQEKPTTRRIVEIVREVALALHHAHQSGIVHRDVKPQNVMVDPQGKPHVMDFGLARDTSIHQQLTKTGQILGTPVYMAPEQITGRGIGPCTDIYALGSMLYRALVGKPPFLSSEPASLYKQILMDEPKLLRRLDTTISADLETITLKCLEKEPSRRYPSATEVADEIQRFLDGQAILARPISRSERALRWARRNRTASAALASVVVVVAGATAVVIEQAAMARQEKVQLQEDAVRREERAKIQAEQDATRKEKERAHQDYLKELRWDVAAVLDGVRAGTLLEDSSDAEFAKARLLKHRNTETVRLLCHELDELSNHLAEKQVMSHQQELFLHFLCEVLWNLGIPEAAVPALGRYLITEYSLPEDRVGQLRAVPAGKALCFLGGEEADSLLLDAKLGFKRTDSFWRQVQPYYKRTGITPEFEAETAQGYGQRALTRMDKGDLDGAIADNTRAINIDPYYTDAWINRGIARRANDDINGALADFAQAIKINPNDPKAWYNQAYARQAKRDLDGAISDFTRAIEIDSNVARIWSSRGLVRYYKGDTNGALADTTRAIKIDPKFAIAWINRGIIRQAKGDFVRAIADFSQAIKLTPSQAAVWNNRGIARTERHDLDGAIADFTRALEINPNLAQVWYNRGGALNSKGDIDGAIADTTRALEINPNFAPAWFRRGRTRHAKRDFDGAIADYTRGLAIQPNLGPVWSNRGSARMQKGDLAGAIYDFTRAIEINPSDVISLHNRGLARKDKGDLDGAIEDFTYAIEIDPKYATAWFYRGAVTQVKGDLDGAITDLQRFLDLAPNDPKAPSVQTSLQEMRAQRAKADAEAGK